MRIASILITAAAFAAGAIAQDKVTLSNGDVLTGTVKSLADGKLVITNAAIGDVTVPFASVANIATAGAVELLTVSGERSRRRIAGIDGQALKLEGEGQTVDTLALGNLAQINPPEKPPEKWTGSLTFGANLSAGNTERRSLGAALDAVLRREKDRWSADAAWDYAEDKQHDDPNTPGVDEFGWHLTQRRLGGGLKYDRFLTKEVYGLVATRASTDTLADIQLRWSIGPGLGYQVLETEVDNLLVEAGVTWFSEDYRSNTPTVDYLAARIAYKYRHEFNKTLRLTNAVEAFPSLERAADVYLEMNTKLETNLSKSLIAQLGWIWDYDNTPAPGRERSDHRILFSVGWTF